MLHLKFLIKVEPFPASACMLSHFGCVRLGPRGLAMGFLYLWDSPGENSGVDCHAFLQGIFPTQESNLFLLHLPASAGGFFTISTTWEAYFLPSLSNICVILQKAIFPSLKNHQPATADQSHFESTQTWAPIPVNGSHPRHSSQSLKFSICMLWEQLSKSPSHKKKKKKNHPKGNRKESQRLRESLHGTHWRQRAWFQNK